MKKILLILLSVMILFNSCEKECIDTNVNYSNVDIYNPIVNIIDFQFSYDKCNTCVNNFNIQNNTGFYASYNFNVYQNGVIKYIGYFQLNPYGNIYFDNAFSNCNSSSSNIVVNIW